MHRQIYPNYAEQPSAMLLLETMNQADSTLRLSHAPRPPPNNGMMEWTKQKLPDVPSTTFHAFVSGSTLTSPTIASSRNKQMPYLPSQLLPQG